MAEIVVQSKAQIEGMHTRFGRLAKQAFLTPKYNARNSLFALLLGLLVAVVLVFSIYQQNGAQLLKDLFVGGFLDANVAARWIDKVVALGLAGIAVAIGLKTGLLNIGVSGQMLGGAIVAVLILDQLRLTSIPARAVLACIFTVLGSASIAVFTGALKAYFKVNEVITAIMLNWVMVYVSAFLRDNTAQSIALGAPLEGAGAAAELGYSQHYAQILQEGQDGNYWLLAGMGIILFAVAGVLTYLLIYRSTLGFKMRATGANPSAANYAGFKAKEIILLSFALSGVAAGLAGFVFYFFGNTVIDAPNFPANEGFQALSVALIASSNPLGIVFSSALFALLTGPIGDIATGGIPADAILVFTATVTYFVAITNLFIYYHPIDYLQKLHRKRTARRVAIAQASTGGDA